jgi:hypothetical protein
MAELGTIGISMDSHLTKDITVKFAYGMCRFRIRSIRELHGGRLVLRAVELPAPLLPHCQDISDREERPRVLVVIPKGFGRRQEGIRGLCRL